MLKSPTDALALNADSHSMVAEMSAANAGLTVATDVGRAPFHISMTDTLWLGTFGPPYESTRAWVTASSREKAKEAITEELDGFMRGGVESLEWEDKDGYAFVSSEDVRASVEVREIPFVG